MLLVGCGPGDAGVLGLGGVRAQEAGRGRAGIFVPSLMGGAVGPRGRRCLLGLGSLDGPVEAAHGGAVLLQHPRAVEHGLSVDDLVPGRRRTYWCTCCSSCTSIYPTRGAR